MGFMRFMGFMGFLGFIGLTRFMGLIGFIGYLGFIGLIVFTGFTGFGFLGSRVNLVLCLGLKELQLLGLGNLRGAAPEQDLSTTFVLVPDSGNF